MNWFIVLLAACFTSLGTPDTTEWDMLTIQG